MICSSCTSSSGACPVTDSTASSRHLCYKRVGAGGLDCWRYQSKGQYHSSSAVGAGLGGAPGRCSGARVQQVKGPQALSIQVVAAENKAGVFDHPMVCLSASTHLQVG